MSDVKILTYGEVLDKIKDSKRHLLLGNGFSIACCPERFSYNSLFEHADFEQSGVIVRKLFDELNTYDFELIIKYLQDAAFVVKHYEAYDHDLVKDLENNAQTLKRVLAKTIYKRHPEHPKDISDEMYRACRNFLSGYDHIYTLNYDLLLYWTIMQSNSELPELSHDDGFRKDTSEDSPWVVWNLYSLNKQEIFYLHGALHLFDAEDDFVKYTWKNTNVPLIKQIKDALDNNKYPKIVCEANSADKRKVIRRSAYLHKALRSLLNIGGNLVVYGWSFSDNDDHVLQCIINNKVKRLFVSLYGDPRCSSNLKIINKVNQLLEERNSSFPKRKLTVEYFDAQSAKVWG